MAACFWRGEVQAVYGGGGVVVVVVSPIIIYTRIYNMKPVFSPLLCLSVSVWVYYDLGACRVFRHVSLGSVIFCMSGTGVRGKTRRQCGRRPILRFDVSLPYCIGKRRQRQQQQQQ